MSEYTEKWNPSRETTRKKLSLECCSCCLLPLDEERNESGQAFCPNCRKSVGISEESDGEWNSMRIDRIKELRLKDGTKIISYKAKERIRGAFIFSYGVLLILILLRNDVLDAIIPLILGVTTLLIGASVLLHDLLKAKTKFVITIGNGVLNYYEGIGIWKKVGSFPFDEETNITRKKKSINNFLSSYYLELNRDGKSIVLCKWRIPGEIRVRVFDILVKEKSGEGNSETELVSGTQIISNDLWTYQGKNGEDMFYYRRRNSILGVVNLLTGIMFTGAGLFFLLGLCTTEEKVELPPILLFIIVFLVAGIFLIISSILLLFGHVKIERKGGFLTQLTGVGFIQYRKTIPFNKQTSISIEDEINGNRKRIVIKNGDRKLKLSRLIPFDVQFAISDVLKQEKVS